MKTLKYLSALLLGSSAVHSAHAELRPPSTDNEWNFTVGLGAMEGPRYPGSDQLKLRALPYLGATKGHWILGAAPGTGLPFGVAYNLVQSYGFRAGVGIGASPGKARKENDDERLKGLGDIDGTARAATYASYTWRSLTARTSLSTDIAGKKQGTLATFDLEGRLKAMDGLYVSFGPSVTWADQQYMQTFFGINAGQAANSGRAEYHPSAGLLNAKFGVGADYSLGNYGVGVRFTLIRLQGNAATSPITESVDQSTATLFMTYRF